MANNTDRPSTAKHSSLKARDECALLLISLGFVCTLFWTTWKLAEGYPFRSEEWICRESDIASYTFPLIAATIAAVGTVVRIMGQKRDAAAYALSVLFLIVSTLAFVRFKATGTDIGWFLLTVLLIQLALFLWGAFSIDRAKSVGWLALVLIVGLVTCLSYLRCRNELPELNSCEMLLKQLEAQR